MPKGSTTQAITDINKNLLEMGCGRRFLGNPGQILRNQRLHLKMCPICKGRNTQTLTVSDFMTGGTKVKRVHMSSNYDKVKQDSFTETSVKMYEIDG